MTLKTFRNNNALGDIEARYVKERIGQLYQLEKDDLMELVALYEIDLLDYIDRLLSDNPIPLDHDTAYNSLSNMEEGALLTLLSVDTEQEYDGLHQYADGEA
ncbi:hypothetical protein [Streptococcus sp. NLN64]|uniref:hypothetical protein n=1 Tax=Streptococcus sp. NLN64 TaxID=2822799 RepID=UPI0018CAE45A|nr:hypothetical protein [Streptococcus sp. NLN64]MBG9368193.1 hypothetical protein [Streptococcus sp. NLN64]